MAFYGRGWNSADGDGGLTGGVNNSNHRASTMQSTTEDGWAYEFGGRFCVEASDGGSVDLRFSMHKVDGSLEPKERMGYSDTVTISAHGSNGNDCVIYTAPINTVADDFKSHTSNLAIPFESGRHLGLAFGHQGSSRLWHQMAAAANVNYDNETLYRKSSTGLTPTDPFGATVATNEGVMTLWVEYEPNVKPTKPATGSMSPSGTITSATPQFESAFVDANTDRGDTITQYQIEMRTGSTGGSLKWNPTLDATSGEKTADFVTYVYDGSALAAGTTYYWKVRHKDFFGAWSDWSNWVSFTYSTGGAVGQASTVIGKQEAVNGFTFVAPYTNGGGLSTNLVAMRLLNPSGSVARSEFQKAATVAPGGNISITFAETGWANLARGATYASEFRARDTAGIWTDWGPNRTFNINAIPSVPSGLQPSNSSASPNRPLLTLNASDVDDSVATGLTVEARIKSAAGSVLFTRTMTYNATTDRWEYQTTSTDLASFATYKWDARAYDGTVYSAYSPEATFIYAAGPSVVITTPTVGQVFATNVPTFAWTVVANQVAKRIDIYSAADDTLVNSWSENSTTNTFTVPNGYLYNNLDFYVIVTLTDNVGLTGSSAATAFSISYPTPTNVANFIVSDWNGIGALLTWEPAENPPSDFARYLLYRRNLNTNEQIIIADISNIARNTYVDPFPISGVPMRYYIRKVIYQGDREETMSDYSSADWTTTLRYPVIVSTRDPESYHIELRILSAFDLTPKENTVAVFTWGASAPTMITDLTDYVVASGSFEVPNAPAYGNPKEIVDQLRAIRKLKKEVCYRDERGEKIFGWLELKIKYKELGSYVVDVVVTETAFTEAVA